MEPSPHLLTLIAGLADPANRSEAAQALATYLGGESLLIFVYDAEVRAALPAPGFVQTLPRGRAWRAFLEACLADGLATCALPYPTAETYRPATGLATADRSILVVLGNAPRVDDMEVVCRLMPLLAAAFRGERSSLSAAVQARLAQDAAAQARSLAQSLEVARQQLQGALHATREARRSAAFLAEASALLAAQLDYEGTLPSVAQLVTAELVDYCAIDLLEPDDTYRRIAVSHRDPARMAKARHVAWRPWHSIQRSEDTQDVSIATTDAAWRPVDLPTDPNLASGIRELELETYLTILLRSHGDTLGVLTLACGPGQAGRTPGPGLVNDLAYRIATAVHNARLFTASQEALRLRDQFLSLASHELKTPLTSLLGYVQVLERRAQRSNDISERDLRGLQMMTQQAKRLHRLIDDLFDIARIQLGAFAVTLQPVDLTVLVPRVVEEMRPMLERHSLAVQTVASPVVVSGDEQRLEQVLHNLIQNAAKYSPRGGPIMVAVSTHADHAHIAVSDHGIGIPAAAQARLFERFFRASNVSPQNISGMGIGLFVVKEIVTLHGGIIRVNSTEGVGSTFTVQLPLMPSGSESPPRDGYSASLPAPSSPAESGQ